MLWACRLLLGLHHYFPANSFLRPLRSTLQPISYQNRPAPAPFFPLWNGNTSRQHYRMLKACVLSTEAILGQDLWRIVARLFGRWVTTFEFALLPTLFTFQHFSQKFGGSRFFTVCGWNSAILDALKEIQENVALAFLPQMSVSACTLVFNACFIAYQATWVFCFQHANCTDSERKGRAPSYAVQYLRSSFQLWHGMAWCLTVVPN